MIAKTEGRTADTQLRHYSQWFYAAALYNFLWGSLTILFPEALFRIIGLPLPNYLALWQVVGMFVLVYAPGYWWVARHPARFPQLVLIGLLGKLLGPVGFVWSVVSGQLPLAFGLTILTNDLIWWPAFFLYLGSVAQIRGGWRSILLGDC
jgi:hypothetical protein